MLAIAAVLAPLLLVQLLVLAMAAVQLLVLAPVVAALRASAY